MTQADRILRGIAEPAGSDDKGCRLFRLGRQLLTEDELQATAEKQYATELQDAELDHELALVNRRIRSYDPAVLEHLRAIKAVPDDAENVDGETAASAKLHLRALEILEVKGKGDN